ncbi:MAG: cytochrome c maturation protein CcmE [Candidatus Thermoplasmatota archaeon]|nr:cytochrome c maturation protein CcmE [Candidatus Thermoplasmatota archaeon]
MPDSERRTNTPWSSWSKGLLAFSVLIATGIVVFITVDEQSMYVSVEEVVSGDYQDGANLQVHGTITDLKIDDCVMVDGNYSLRVDISSIILPDTFAEDKGATFTGILRVVDGEMYLKAVKVQMGCPSKYQPAEE